MRGLPGNANRLPAATAPPNQKPPPGPACRLHRSRPACRRWPSSFATWVQVKWSPAGHNTNDSRPPSLSYINPSRYSCWSQARADCRLHTSSVLGLDNSTPVRKPIHNTARVNPQPPRARMNPGPLLPPSSTVSMAECRVPVRAMRAAISPDDSPIKVSPTADAQTPPLLPRNLIHSKVSPYSTPPPSIPSRARISRTTHCRARALSSPSRFLSFMTSSEMPMVMVVCSFDVWRWCSDFANEGLPLPAFVRARYERP